MFLGEMRYCCYLIFATIRRKSTWKLECVCVVEACGAPGGEEACGRALFAVGRSGKLADGGSSRPAVRNLASERPRWDVCIAFCQNFKEENATQNPRRNYRPASLLEIGTPACKNIFHATPAADLFPFRRIKLHHQRQGSDSSESVKKHFLLRQKFSYCFSMCGWRLAKSSTTGNLNFL